MRRVDRRERRGERRARAVARLELLQEDVEVGAQLVLADRHPWLVVPGRADAQDLEDVQEVVRRIEGERRRDGERKRPARSGRGRREQDGHARAEALDESPATDVGPELARKPLHRVEVSAERRDHQREDGAHNDHVTDEEKNTDNRERDELREQETQPADAARVRDADRAGGVLHADQPRAEDQKEDARPDLEDGAEGFELVVSPDGRVGEELVLDVHAARDRKHDHAQQHDAAEEGEPEAELAAELQDLAAHRSAERWSGNCDGHQRFSSVRLRKTSSRSCCRGLTESGSCPFWTRNWMSSRPRPFGAAVTTTPSSARAFAAHGSIRSASRSLTGESTLTAYSPGACTRSATFATRTRRPWLMIATRVQICCTSLSTWLEMKTVLPEAARPRSRSRISTMPAGSRPLAGSSRINRSGSLSSETARPSRCFIPIE